MLADSTMAIILRTHTGVTRLYVSAKEPDMATRSYQREAYYKNEGEPLSFVNIAPDERGEAVTGQ